MDAEGTPRRVPVAVYICTADTDIADLIGAHCEQYAAARDWHPVEIITDTDRQSELMSRPGWVRLLTLLSDGTARGAVTYSPAMVTPDPQPYATVRTLLADRGGFLVAVRTTNGDPEALPRRTPAQSLRRQNIADAAYEGCGAEWQMYGGDVR